MRSAEVQPGLSLHAQATVTAPPGELPGWIWSFDCAEGCNHSIPGLELGVFHGVSDSTNGHYFGAGFVAPLNPFVEAYWQFSEKSRARGMGGRLGIPLSGWADSRIFYRHDLGAGVTSNTNFVIATGSSPNGANSATFLALVQSFGLIERGARTSFIPAISVGVTRTVRTRYEERETAVGFLGVLSLGFELHRQK